MKNVDLIVVFIVETKHARHIHCQWVCLACGSFRESSFVTLGHTIQHKQKYRGKHEYISLPDYKVLSGGAISRMGQNAKKQQISKNIKFWVAKFKSNKTIKYLLLSISMRDKQTITKQTRPLLYNTFGCAAQLPVTVNNEQS